MNVKLISHTKPSSVFSFETDIQTLEDLCAYCARVSNPNNQQNTTTSRKLIKYLVKNKHWSPLEMVNACIEIETTRDIARQILRHRSFSFQEFSQRYADPTEELEFVTREARLQDPKNRQNSIECDDIRIKSTWEVRQLEVIDRVQKEYRWAIENGIAKEQARSLLPEGLTMSRLYMNGTLRSWVHYIELRSANGPQNEHAEIAMACAVEIAKVFPLIKDIQGE